ncbi:hypothetical protein J2Y74_001800 [Pseudomonas migulae]|uniref:hypothetical protein n=1 Tax=Pseudomonas migulae TaxID=78543 RepID=UPI00209E24BD|nr:hypothetical protein [Pseudomonas migulae]MCP1517490.1 hypothetical protein [Pseudomonas migulae]
MQELDAMFTAINQYLCLGIGVHQVVVSKVFAVLGSCFGDKCLSGFPVSRPRAVGLALPAAPFFAQMQVWRYQYSLRRLVLLAIEDDGRARRLPDCLYITELSAEFRLGFSDESLGVLDSANDFSP